MKSEIVRYFDKDRGFRTIMGNPLTLYTLQVHSTSMQKQGNGASNLALTTEIGDVCENPNLHKKFSHKRNARIADFVPTRGLGW